MLATPQTKVAILVEPFDWKPVDVIAHAIEGAMKKFAPGIDARLAREMSAPVPHGVLGLGQTLLTLIAQTEFLLTQSTDCEFAVRVRPVSFPERIHHLTWEHRFVLVTIRHRLTFEWFFIVDVGMRKIPEELFRLILSAVSTACASRDSPNTPPADIDERAKCICNAIVGAVEAAIREKYVPVH